MKIRYNQGDDILEVVVKDATGAKIEVRRANKQDHNECGKIIKWLIQKHGFKFKIDKMWIDMDNEFFKI